MPIEPVVRQLRHGSTEDLQIPRAIARWPNRGVEDRTDGSACRLNRLQVAATKNCRLRRLQENVESGTRARRRGVFSADPLIDPGKESSHG